MGWVGSRGTVVARQYKLLARGSAPCPNLRGRWVLPLLPPGAAARVVGVEHWLNNNNNNDHFHFDYDAPHFDGGTVSRGR